MQNLVINTIYNIDAITIETFPSKHQRPVKSSDNIMRFYEFNIKPQKPLTPSQARIDSLQKQVKNAQNLLKAERKKQKQQKIQQQIQKLGTNNF